MKVPFKDLHHLPEEDRIKTIGDHATKQRGEVVGFFVDDDAKADRYVEKLKASYPSLTVIWRGPFRGVIFMKVAVIQ